MRKIIFTFFVIAFAAAAQATKVIVNQLPLSGNVLSLNLNAGDTIVFNLSSQFSIRQVSEYSWNAGNSNILNGGFLVKGSGNVVVPQAGTHYFVVNGPNGQTIKGQINAQTGSNKVQFSSIENPIEAKIIGGRLQVAIKSGISSGTISLHDVLGNKVFETAANDNIDWSLAGLKSGVYFVAWRDNKSNFTKRLVYRQEN
jgi:hypothetical protein